MRAGSCFQPVGCNRAGCYATQGRLPQRLHLRQRPGSAARQPRSWRPHLGARGPGGGLPTRLSAATLLVGCWPQSQRQNRHRLPNQTWRQLQRPPRAPGSVRQRRRRLQGRPAPRPASPGAASPPLAASLDSAACQLASIALSPRSTVCPHESILLSTGLACCHEHWKT